MSTLNMQTLGSGPPLLMLHGWAMHSGVWSPFAQRLAKKYQLLCIDLPGHGRREMNASFTLPDLARQILAQLPEGRCHCLGWSLGATLALYLAACYPQRVSSLILIAGNPCFIQRHDWLGMPPALLHNFVAALQLNQQRTLLRFLSLQVQGEAHAKDMFKTLKQCLAEYDSPNPSALQAGLQILMETDLRSEFAQLKCPVLCVFGERDTLVPVQVSQGLLALLPDARIELINHAAHLPFLSDAQKVCVLLDDFITDD